MRKIVLWVALVVMGVGVATLRAGSLVFDVTLNTQPLTAPGVDAGPFYVDFQLTGGNGNVVTIDSFDFGGGAAVGPAGYQPGGDASGDMGGSVTLTSVAADNEIWEQFNPGATLSFRVTTTEVLTTTNPDGFVFNIQDNTGSNIPTQDPPSNDFLSLTYSSPNGPIFSLFGNNPNIAPNGGNTPIGEIDAPTVTYPQVAPLPSTGLACLVLLIGCGMVTFLRNMHRKS